VCRGDAGGADAPARYRRRGGLCPKSDAGGPEAWLLADATRGRFVLGLAIGDVELHLVDAPARGSDIDPTGPHFCVFVTDLGRAIRELDDREIPYLRGAQGDVVQIWITDPAGNTIELQQDRPAV
jgi:hypothetical protein